MAISTVRRGKNHYVQYGYRDGKKHVRIYCGKIGLKSTLQKIKRAKKQHLAVKIQNTRGNFN